ncbi:MULTISPECIES: cytochrome c oxidase assembly protein [Protofrankia]|uniref:Cytochrome C oxidase assembly protein n=1 Tax=Protofrankia coriariae TaxID=1562887 RepID=A0ABR5F0M9_9ACTN|nr:MULTISPECIES: cytochrome c oxidase assembly protein [Protofrankia]KLL10264.1 cytochrome C oxidase assembly protein [Protofrankia coriariae]ONH37205.1 cytochrome C oxidase assembly protein [Protofrankia sp. BMG5.30]
MTSPGALATAGAGSLLASSGQGELPPPPTVGRMLLHISPEPGPLLLVALMGGLYLFGVSRLTDRGDAWSRWRTASWLAGLVVVAYALVGGIAAYDTALFSAHAVQHMLLGTVAPIPLALGAPVTLALRALPLRPRRLLVRLLHSRVARVVTFPLVGFAAFIVSLYGLYFTGLYEASMRHTALHLFLHVHFLAVGCLFYWPIIGLDPMPGRLPYWGRLLLLFVTFPMHALWALAMFTTNEVFAADWYAELGRTWGSSPLGDQQTGAGLMWAAGEVVGAMVFVALFIQWSRADGREAAREDRRLDRLLDTAASPARARPGTPGHPATERDGAAGRPRETEQNADRELGPVPEADPEAELLAREAAYNAWLARLAANDTAAPRRPATVRDRTPGTEQG